MKIAITARGASPHFEVDESFGRAYWFLIYDTEHKSWEAVDNNLIRNAMENAGEMACELLQEYGVEILLTGETGPKAFRRLVAGGIGVFHGAAGTVRECLLRYLNGEMHVAGKPNGPGSPYCLVSEVRMPGTLRIEPKLSLVNPR